MKLTRATTWPGITRLNDLRDELDRIFDAPLSRTSELLGWTPAFDVYENKDNFVVKAELPGMKREDLSVSLHDGSLIVSGERKAENYEEGTEVYRSERFFGKFQRSVTLPNAVAASKVKAEYKDGVLTVTLPKSDEAKPKQIEVNIL